MAADIKRLAVHLIIPFAMLWGAASMELRSGDSLRMNCSGLPVDSWTLAQDKQPIIVVQYKPTPKNYACAGSFMSVNQPSGSCRPEVTIDQTSGQYVTISSIAYGDAGTYSCNSNQPAIDVVVVQNDGPTLQVSRQNGIPAPLPTNNEVSQNDKLSFNCTLQFGGLKSPTMELVLRSYSGTEKLLRNSNSASVSFSQNQYVSLATDYTVSPTDGSFTIICRLPSFNTSAMMETVQFNSLYGPIFRNGNSQKTVINVNSGRAALNCTADSYPLASYGWFRTDHGQNKSISGAGDMISVSENGDYRCTVSNSRTNIQISKDFTVTVNSSASVPSSTATFILLLLCLLSLHL